MFGRTPPAHRFTLTVTRPHAGVVTVGLPAIEVKRAPATPAAAMPLSDAWTYVLETVVAQAFAGRDVCFILPDPPLDWGDFTLSDLAPRFVADPHPNLPYQFAFAPHVGTTALRHATQSQDFLHAALIIAALSETHIRPLLAALRHARAHYPDYRVYERLHPDELTALFDHEIAVKAAAEVEFMECDYDGDTLYWYHPTPAALETCLATLQSFASIQAWEFQAY